MLTNKTKHARYLHRSATASVNGPLIYLYMIARMLALVVVTCNLLVPPQTSYKRASQK